MDSLELARFVRLRRKAGADVSAISTGLYRKSSVALAPLLLTLVGLPFAFRLREEGSRRRDRDRPPPRPRLPRPRSRARQGRRDRLPPAAPGGVGSQSLLLARGRLGPSRDPDLNRAESLDLRRDREPGGLRERLREVGPLPGELREAPPEVPVGGGLPEDRPPQVERLDDPLRRQLEVVADEPRKERRVDLLRAERLDVDRDRDRRRRWRRRAGPRPGRRAPRRRGSSRCSGPCRTPSGRPSWGPSRRRLPRRAGPFRRRCRR